jgi:polyisoprenoid-binding protein YceI
MTTATRAHRAQPLAPGAWSVDPDRSEVAFAIGHFRVATVHGRFTRFCGAVEHDEDGIAVYGVVISASVDTGNQLRDDRVRGTGFLDAAAHPEIRFASRSAEPAAGGALRITGDLTIMGITRPVTLEATVRPDRGSRVRITARGSLRRSDFGIEPQSLLEAGVGDRIDLALDVSLRRVRGRRGSTAPVDPM